MPTTQRKKLHKTAQVQAKSRWIIAITGASGICYGLRLLEVCARHVDELHVIISDSALRVLFEEQGIKISASGLSWKRLFGTENKKAFFYSLRDIGALPASGSAIFTGMAIVPCSMGTLAAVANGLSQNLIHRAADVTLKEGRRLIVVPRETPLSIVHLENMLKLKNAGASIVPAMPGFYHRPKTLEDLIDMQVMKILDQMGLENTLSLRWKSQQSA